MAIPEDPGDWEDERRFASRLKELLNQEGDAIEDFKVVGFTGDGKQVFDTGDVAKHLK